ncbi:MAG: hypothetical protein KGQ58_05415 [Proteobacteria bacterium]|nr:hypothetical protein [Pseudomonadota bacterium]MDE3208019.1 hypothetical protein [Pseudomonadota bacterium]
MRFLVSIDDTDNLDSPGTGEIAQLIRDDLEKKGYASTAFITRHQLFIHSSIAYTSHNSSMCFELQSQVSEPMLTGFIADQLEHYAVEDSDPGLCIINLAHYQNKAGLIQFGQAAKTDVLNKDLAYALAQQSGIHLSEHGGDGSGIIGALAGAGLRLSGEDGRLRGSLSFNETSMTVTDILQHPDIEGVFSTNHEPLCATERIAFIDHPKTVMQGGRPVLLVTHDTSLQAWRNLTRKELKHY